MKTLVFLLTMAASMTSFASNKVLIIVSAATQMNLQNGKNHSTGYFLGELTDPLDVLIENGIDFDIATPGGIKPTMDQDGNRLFYWSFNSKKRSLALDFAKTNEKLNAPLNLDEITKDDLENYVGLFIPGGHGPMVDLVHHSKIPEILQYFHHAQKPTALLCHAPAVLLSANKETPWIYAGYQMTVVSNTEERMAEKFFLRGRVPFEYPESALRKAGALVKTSKMIIRSTVIQDRELITGQNPFAGDELGQVFVNAIRTYQESQ